MFKINTMQWYENKFLNAGDDPAIEINEFDTIVIHLHHPMCIIRVLHEDHYGPDWRKPEGVCREFEYFIPAEDRKPEDNPIWKFTLWIFRPESIPPEEKGKYEEILGKAWRYYMGDALT